MQSLVELIEIEATPPSLSDNTGDLDRLRKSLAGKLEGSQPLVPMSRMASIARSFRQAEFKGAALVVHFDAGIQLIDFLPQAPSVLPAIALDLGTTHLEASLLDLNSGKVLERETLVNAQLEFGSDILTRIHFAADKQRSTENLVLLQKKVIQCIRELAGKLAGKRKISTQDIVALCVSGNTTMIHFFLQLDPYHLCREPYIPVVNSPDPFFAHDLGLSFHPGATVWVMPSVGSYFGGDLISGILASNLDQQEATSMLIDVGTNAEVVVGNREWLIACAGAAGPALEGGVARMGMRADTGAIEHCSIDPDTGKLDYETIGSGPARGICGSGMIDLVAGLYLARIIDIRGKFRPKQPQAEGCFIKQDDGLAYVVVPAAEADKGQPVLLSQVDIDAMMRSKAAMYSILTTITNQVGVAFDELHRIYVAGAFGKHIAPQQAIVLGMLPDLDLDVYQPLGNSSLAGAESILLDRRAWQRSREIVSKVTYVELNVNQEFMIRFSGSRFIPHTDHSLFPSVPYFDQP